MKHRPVLSFLTAQAIIVLLLAWALAYSYPAASRPLFILGIVNAVLCLVHAFIIQAKVVPLSKLRQR